MKLYIILCVVVLSIDAYPLRTLDPTGSKVNFGCDTQCQKNYLIKYGYITPSEENNILEAFHIGEEEEVKEGIINLQKDAGIIPTGILNSETMLLLQTPRCGVLWKGKRQKRFTLVGNGWNTQKNKLNETVVTYYLDLSNFDRLKSNNLSIDIIRSIFSTATSRWSNISLLSIQEVFKEEESNITIQFLKGNHGDNWPFDGPGQILAHAFFPGSGRGGDVHFDIEEMWTLWDEDVGTSLFSVAIHELGHSLGIGHSSQKDSVMYAWYQSNKFELQSDDINAINSVYGVKPKYKFAPLDPKYRIYPSRPVVTTTRQPVVIKPRFTTTTRKYNFDTIKKFLIQNSKVIIYPKSALNF